MEKFLVLIVVLLFIYNLLKPNKKKQGKSMVNNIQDLKILSAVEEKNAMTLKKIKEKSQNNVPIENTTVEVKNYDENITLSEYIESKKRNKGFENLEKSELYTDTNSSFEKENEKWLKQSLKDTAEHTDTHTKKTKFSAKEIKKAYITSQIMERKYI